MSNKELSELRVKLLRLARQQLDFQNSLRDKDKKFLNDDSSNMMFRTSSGKFEAYLNVIDILKDYEKDYEGEQSIILK